MLHKLSDRLIDSNWLGWSTMASNPVYHRQMIRAQEAVLRLLRKAAFDIPVLHAESGIIRVRNAGTQRR